MSVIHPRRRADLGQVARETSPWATMDPVLGRGLPKFMAYAAAWCTLALGGCFDAALNEGQAVSCESDTDCFSPAICQPDIQRCITPRLDAEAPLPDDMQQTLTDLRNT